MYRPRDYRIAAKFTASLRITTVSTRCGRAAGVKSPHPIEWCRCHEDAMRCLVSSCRLPIRRPQPLLFPPPSTCGFISEPQRGSPVWRTWERSKGKSKSLGVPRCCFSDPGLSNSREGRGNGVWRQRRSVHVDQPLVNDQPVDHLYLSPKKRRSANGLNDTGSGTPGYSSTFIGR